MPEFTMMRSSLSKTLKQTGTPETCTAGHRADVAVLFEIIELGIVA
jgi:hypothetical protein